MTALLPPRQIAEMSDTRQPTTRDERLKAALRDNLRRRKAQARGRADTETGAPSEKSAEEPSRER